MENNEKNCPMCGNHCDKEELQCGRGKRYFGESGESAQHGKEGHAHGAPFDVANEEPAKLLLRRCGHLLHHGGAEHLLDALSAEEKETLCAILNKALKETENK